MPFTQKDHVKKNGANDAYNVSCFKGVDNNGAGMAALLEVVRQVTELNKQGSKRQNTIFFIAFDGTELGRYRIKE